MKRGYCIRLLSFILSLAILSTSSWAGQVITEDVRLWAKQAVKEEKALKSVKGQNTLAVLYFLNKTGDSDLDPVQKGLALMLITDLSTVEGIQVIERIKLQALVEEMGFGTSGLVQAGTAPKVGRLLGARWLEGGNMTGKQSQLQVEANLVDVPTDKISTQQTAEGNLSELFRIEKEILFATIRDLKIKISPEKEKALRRPCSTNFKALQDLFRGIDASDRGNYEKAGDFYDKSLKEDPTICVAESALTELRDLKLILPPGKKNRSAEMLESLRNDTSLTNQLEPKDATRREPTPAQIETPLDIDVHFPQ
jgi:TolB-like protein